MLRKKPFDHSGVSEVIGTILVLLITVILFSTIILWVYTIPTPSASGRVSFDGGLEGIYVAGDWDGAYINLTHLGGDDLFEGPTRIYLTIDDQTEVLRTRGEFYDIDNGYYNYYGVDGSDATWNIGEMWSYRSNKTLIKKSAAVSVMVVDLDKGLVLWNEALLGVAGDQAPIFLDKWVDSDNSTATRDPVKVNDTFALYAKVVDPDSDLNAQSVWAYLTFLTSEDLRYTQLLDNGNTSVGDRVPGDGIFSRSLAYQANASWDGGIIILNATDMEGNEMVSRLILQIAQPGPPGPPGPQGQIEGELWEFIGSNQIDLNAVFWTHGGEGANPGHWHPIFRTSNAHTQSGGMIWHIVMNNHGNRTFFPGGYSGILLDVPGSPNFFYLMRNDTSPYTVNTGDIDGFWYDEDYVLDVNLDDQQKGGKKLDLKFSAKAPGGSAFEPIGTKDRTAWVFVSVTGVMGPLDKTLQQIADQYCGGGEVQLLCYDPADYLYDGTEWETRWAGGLIPFISFYIFSTGDGTSCEWPPPVPVWYGGSASCS